MGRVRSRSRRILRALSSSAAPRLAVALGVLLAIPATGVGWFNDDFQQRLVGEGAFPELPYRAWQAYDFTRPGVTAADLVDRGFLPWFTDPELSFRFLRPLSSLSLALDQQLFGRDALAAHLHGLAWYALLLAFAAALQRRVLRPAEATIATAVFALAVAPSMALTWVAARHALMGGALALGAVWLHVAARQSGGRRRAVGSAVFLALGLLSSESALAAVPFIVLYELLVMDDGLARRLGRVSPAALLAAAHLLAYGLLGFGVKHSGAYLSPFSDPLAFGLAFLERGPVLLAEAYGALPSVLWAALTPARPLMIAWGLVTVALVLALLWAVRDQLRPRERRHLAWLFLASVAAIAPMVGGFLGGRLLLVAGVGASSLIGVALVQTLLAEPVGRARWLARAAVAVLVLLHFGLAPLFRLGMVAVTTQIAEGERRIARELDPSACPEGAHALILAGADPALSMFIEPALHFHAPATAARLASVQALSMAPADHTFERVSEDAFTLRIGGGRPVSAFEAVYRHDPLREGQVVHAGALTVEVTDTEGGRWSAARFSLEGGLDGVCFGRWDGDRLRLSAPPPVGTRWTVPHHPGPGGG